jgi:hypothetical protein
MSEQFFVRLTEWLPGALSLKKLSLHLEEETPEMMTRSDSSST